MNVWNVVGDAEGGCRDEEWKGESKKVGGRKKRRAGGAQGQGRENTAQRAQWSCVKASERWVSNVNKAKPKQA